MEQIAVFVRKHRWVIPAAAVLALVLVILLVKSLWDPQRAEVREGTKYLKELESKDLASVEASVKEVKKQAQAEAIEAGELSVWAQFSDYVIFGDSRTVGFYFHEFLDKQRVLADGGLTIADIPDYEDQMVALNPSYLFCVQD